MFTWEDLDFWTTNEWQSLREYVNDNPVCPAKDDIFKAFDLCAFEDTKVVILGQDPYPNPKYANGLAFSVSKGITLIPPSLQNIFKEYEDDTHYPRPRHGDLTAWALQGVLLLNSSLTTAPYRARAHHGWGWEVLVDEVLRRLEARGKCVFILWGKDAQEHLSELLPSVEAKRNRVILSSHPSPLAAHKDFLGSRPFSRCNALLRELGHKPVNWRLL